MVCLHGLGDNKQQYRNSLINTLKWPTLFPNTIFICPDGGDDKNKDFYQPAGDEAFILAALNYGLNNYTINPNKILLQGFSLGGRSALKFALDNPEKQMAYFKYAGYSRTFRFGKQPRKAVCNLITITPKICQFS